MRKIHRNSLLSACAVGLLYSATVQAHDPWFLLPSYNLAPGGLSPIYIGYGHVFPLDGFLAKQNVKSAEIVSLSGKRSPLKEEEFGYSISELDAAGTYILLASQQGGFYTRTKQGNKRQSKEGLKDVINCSYSMKNAKALVNVGSGGGPFDQRYAHPLEIIPLTNPADLKVGDFMNIQILMHGEPYRSEVYATYSGFSSDGAYAYTRSADDAGKASIKILNSGAWMIKVKAEEPYSDTKVCDIQRYTATLTFGIR